VNESASPGPQVRLVVTPPAAWRRYRGRLAVVVAAARSSPPPSSFRSASAEAGSHWPKPRWCQADGKAPGGDVVDRAAPGGGGDAVVDQPLVQRQIRELALLDARAGAHLIRWLAGPVATYGGRCRGTRPGQRAINAVRLSRRSSGGCRARPAGGIRLPWDLGVGHRVAASGSDAEELRQLLAGDQLPSVDLETGQIAKAHLLMEQAAG